MVRRKSYNKIIDRIGKDKDNENENDNDNYNDDKNIYDLFAIRIHFESNKNIRTVDK